MHQLDQFRVLLMKPVVLGEPDMCNYFNGYRFMIVSDQPRFRYQSEMNVSFNFFLDPIADKPEYNTRDVIRLPVTVLCLYNDHMRTSFSSQV